MSFEVRIVADSIAPNGKRITTFRLNYAMIIHWDMLTHRALSRNAESGRVISATRRVRMVKSDPFKPATWQQDEKGMRPGDPLAPEVQDRCDTIWGGAAGAAMIAAEKLAELGAHRQQVNSLLIPFGHIGVVVTATEWGNFFALRVPPGAREEFREVALEMARQYRDGTPYPMQSFMWHLPFVTPDELAYLCSLRNGQDDYLEMAVERDLIAASVARCARVSYAARDGKPTTLAADRDLAARLETAGHASPFEHQARPADSASERSGNFVGWHQHRQMLAKPVHADFDFATLEQFS